MNLITELASERAELKKAARKIASELEAEARQHIEAVGSCAATVVALEGVQRRTYYLSWNNRLEKEIEFERVEADMKERFMISATVYLIPSRVLLNDGTEERALAIVSHTSDWKEMRLIPFRIDEGGVRWAKRPIVQSGFLSNLLKHPYMEAS